MVDAEVEVEVAEDGEEARGRVGVAGLCCAELSAAAVALSDAERGLSPSD